VACFFCFSVEHGETGDKGPDGTAPDSAPDSPMK
jgi:hypothetical protein